MKRGHVEVKYCLTGDMVGDFFTKPLNGAKFCKFCNTIMNCGHDESTLNGYNVIPEQIDPKLEPTSTLGSHELLGIYEGCHG